MDHPEHDDPAPAGEPPAPEDWLDAILYTGDSDTDGDDGRHDGETDPYAGVDLSDLDGEDWDAVAEAVAELRALEPSARARRFDEWRRRSATGQFLVAVALGLQQVFQPRDEGVQIELADSGGDDDDPYRLALDPNPQASVMVLRPGALDPPPSD